MRRKGSTFIACGGDEREYARQFDVLLTELDSLIEEYRDADEKVKWPKLLLQAGLGKVKIDSLEDSFELLSVLPSVDCSANSIDADMPGGGGDYQFYYCPSKEKRSLIKGLKQLIRLLKGNPKYEKISERAEQSRAKWAEREAKVKEQRARKEKERQEEIQLAIAARARWNAETQVRDFLAAKENSNFSISEVRRLEPPSDIDVAARLLVKLILWEPSYTSRDPDAYFKYLVPHLLEWLSKYHSLESLLKAVGEKEPRCLGLMLAGATQAIRELQKHTEPVVFSAYARGIAMATRDAIAFYNDLVEKLQPIRNRQ